MPITVATALGDINHVIHYAILSGLSFARTKSKLEECTGRMHAHNALKCFEYEYPPIGAISVAVAVDYFRIIEEISVLVGSNVRRFKRSIEGERGSKLIRTVFDTTKDQTGYSKLKISVVRELIGRLDEIAEEFNEPWDEVARRLKKTSGRSRIQSVFSSPEVDVEKTRTFDEILSEMTSAKPTPYDYQLELVANFNLIKHDNNNMHVIWLPTGAGKTLVANECVNSFLNSEPDSKVLWLAPNWELLEQAAINMAAFFGRKEELRYAGNGRKLLGMDKFTRRDKKARVIYTTLTSWYRGKGKKTNFPQDNRPLLVVYDESHWGLGATMLNNLFKYYLGKATLLGLSATQKEHGKIKLLSPVKTYSDLVGSVLATPLVKHINTGVDWNPTLTPCQTFSQGSLAELGNNPKRNDFVVSTVIKKLNSYNKVLVFACNIKHAETLNSMLCNKNVSSGVFHSGLNHNLRISQLNKFKTGALKILVSVNMATHGLDIPEIDCIVLARPTESAALCSQMVGRGARLAPGKTEFHIIDFTDNMLKHPEYVFDPKELFSATLGYGAGDGVRPESDLHCEPRTVSFEQLNNIPGVEGLQYAVGHTFGIEIELTALPSNSVETVPKFDDQEWHRIAKRIIECIRAEKVDMSEEPTEYHGGDVTRWRVEEDCSCGWEIISPPLRNQQGFEELYIVCKALNKFIRDYRELMIDFRCGLHITLSTKLKDKISQQNVLRMVQRLEPGLFTLVKPSRLFKTSLYGYEIAKNNSYCKPSRSILMDEDEYLDLNYANPHHSVNFCKAQDSDYNLFEVRMHHSSTDYLEIIPWISLWMHIFNTARFSTDGSGVEGKVFPRGDSSINDTQAKKEDIFELFDNDKILINKKLKAALLAKRISMKPLWENILPNRVDSWDGAGWYD